jgi:hypothetical protein
MEARYKSVWNTIALARTKCVKPLRSRRN